MELTFPHIWLPRGFNREKCVHESRIGTPGSMTGGMQSLSGVEAGKFGSSGPPTPPLSPLYWWNAGLDIFSDDAHTTPQTTNGGVVATWKEQISGSAYLAQSTNNSRPTLVVSAQNSKPGLSFDGSDDFLGVTGLSYGNPFTAFDIFAVHTRAESDIISGRSASGVDFRLQKMSDNTLEMDPTGAGPQTASAVSDNVYIIVCTVFNGSDSSTRIRVNAGTASTTPNIAPTTGTATTLRLGGGSAGASAQMVYLEKIIYSSALSTTDETTVRDSRNGWYAIF